MNIYKAKVNSVSTDYILVDIPELGIEKAMVKYMLAPYSIPTKIGIKMNLPKPNDDVFIMFMNEKIYANPVIVPLIPIKDLQDKTEIVVHTDKLKVVGEGNDDVKDEGIQLGKTMLTQAVRYDVLLEILNRLFYFLLLHKHVVPFPPGTPTITLFPDDIVKLNKDLNPNTAMIITNTMAEILKEALKSKKVKLE